RGLTPSKIPHPSRTFTALLLHPHLHPKKKYKYLFFFKKRKRGVEGASLPENVSWLFYGEVR
ncbi:MAG: hypothetical protein AB1405_07905, partial [Bdellovibrionota bacterium]